MYNRRICSLCRLLSDRTYKETMYETIAASDRLRSVRFDRFRKYIGLCAIPVRSRERLAIHSKYGRKLADRSTSMPAGRIFFICREKHLRILMDREMSGSKILLSRLVR